MNHDECPSCAAGDELLSNAHAMVRRDLHPVTPGPLLVLTRRHVADFFETRLDERAPDGFNVGINVGEAAGQTIPHVQIHLLPRYRGDTPRPHGGVRGVIPGKQAY